MKILITGGRAPVALDLARRLNSQGHQVFSADSVKPSLTSVSNSVQKSFLVSPARQAPEQYLQDLQQIMQENEIDLLIPTCEEVFYVAKGRERLFLSGRVFCESLEKLSLFHDKWSFNQWCLENGLSVPQSFLLQKKGDLKQQYSNWPDFVLKPVFSRFAEKALIRPSQQQLQGIAWPAGQSWVLQKFIPGREYCNYNVAVNGKLKICVIYLPLYRAGQGAGINLQSVNHEKIQAWVEKFVQTTQWHGQLSFDFIESTDGQIWCLECNPRATSGLHLLPDNFRWENIFDANEPSFSIAGQSSAQISLAMLSFGLLSVSSAAELKNWWKSWQRARDIVWRWQDPLPFFAQFLSLWQNYLISRKHKISLLEATTYDIEWNGQP